MKPNITLEKAKELSIIKWKLIINNNGSFGLEQRNNPAIKNIKHNCGFCERWHINDDTDGVERSGCDCNSCEFAKAMGTDCNKDNSLFDQWCNDELFGGTPKKLAQLILDIIKEIPTTNANTNSNN